MAGRTALVPLTDIRDAIRRIERYTAGKSLAAFRRDELVHDAVERCLEIISEASRRLPEEMKARHPGIPWRNVAGLGNVFRHEYDAVSTPPGLGDRARASAAAEARGGGDDPRGAHQDDEAAWIAERPRPEHRPGRARGRRHELSEYMRSATPNCH
jgi:uncharacterized protein with HEPN domain